MFKLIGNTVDFCIGDQTGMKDIGLYSFLKGDDVRNLPDWYWRVSRHSAYGPMPSKGSIWNWKNVEIEAAVNAINSHELKFCQVSPQPNPLEFRRNGPLNESGIASHESLLQVFQPLVPNNSDSPASKTSITVLINNAEQLGRKHNSRTQIVPDVPKATVSNRPPYYPTLPTASAMNQYSATKGFYDKPRHRVCHIIQSPSEISLQNHQSVERPEIKEGEEPEEPIECDRSVHSIELIEPQNSQSQLDSENGHQLENSQDSKSQKEPEDQQAFEGQDSFEDQQNIPNQSQRQQIILITPTPSSEEALHRYEDSNNRCLQALQEQAGLWHTMTTALERSQAEEARLNSVVIQQAAQIAELDAKVQEHVEEQDIRNGMGYLFGEIGKAKLETKRLEKMNVEKDHEIKRLRDKVEKLEKPMSARNAGLKGASDKISEPVFEAETSGVSLRGQSGEAAVRIATPKATNPTMPVVAVQPRPNSTAGLRAQTAPQFYPFSAPAKRSLQQESGYNTGNSTRTNNPSATIASSNTKSFSPPRKRRRADEGTEVEVKDELTGRVDL